jgi:hypothetical protein
MGLEIVPLVPLVPQTVETPGESNGTSQAWLRPIRWFYLLTAIRRTTPARARKEDRDPE